MTDVNPFVFVAATRYAIRRTTTAASEIVANQVELHAAAVAADAGAAAAIVREVDAFVSMVDVRDSGLSVLELRAIKLRWQRAAEAVETSRNGTAA